MPLSWDILKGDGLPGHTVQSDQDQEVVSYHRFGGDSGIEPLVFLRTFDGIKEPFLELSEEFRYFHNLYFDEDKQQFVKINSDGTEDAVGRIAPHRLDLRLREVRQFMAVRGMHLAVYFDIVRYSEMDAGQIDREAATKEIHEDLLRYRFHVSPCNFSSRREHHSFSRLLGKKLIPPLPLEQSGVWPYEKDEKNYEEFKIGIDGLGAPTYYTSDPDQLANYFGANPEAPNFLTPVYFRREVLAKYYVNPERFSVEDGYLRCGGLWGRWIHISSATPELM